MTRIAVLGLGEAGGKIAAQLGALEQDVRGYDPAARPTPDGVVRAADPAAAVAGSEIVICLTTAATAFRAAETVLSELGVGMVYADANTAAPSLKRELSELVAGTGARFADVALLGPIPDRALDTPALASGPGAQDFADALRPLGMPVDVVSEVPGDAATLKLLRSVFMKGIAAAAVESVAAAEAAGHADWLRRELSAVLGEHLLERLLEGSRQHAARRVDEMEAARDLLLELGVEPRIATASAEQLGELASIEER